MHALPRTGSPRDLRQMFQTVEQLSAEASAFLRLTEQDETTISGFRAWYASALLAAYFPQALPVIDRQVLRGAGIDHDVAAGGQCWRSRNITQRC